MPHEPTVTVTQPKRRDLRRGIVALAGFCTFLDLYATQPLLPLFRRLFHASEVDVSLTVSATTLAVALAAPFVGLLADRVGRKPVIVASMIGLTLPTLFAATSPTLHALIAWRFLQGLFMPGIFAVMMAYVSEEWAGSGAAAAMSGYITGNVLGGFCGRYLAGIAAAHSGWREAFVILGLLNLTGALATARWLPASRRFQRQGDWRDSLRAMAAHGRNRILLTTYFVGFNVLFSLVATFTYITFYLAAPPFRLDAQALGSLFFVYLLGAVITPIAGRWIDRLGHRAALVAALITAGLGVLLTLGHSLLLVIIGLTLCCSGIFVCQSSASSFLGVAAGTARSSAAGLYVTFYYVGGSVGAVLPGLVWVRGGWPACVALIVTVQLLTAGLAALFWRRPAPPAALLAD